MKKILLLLPLGLALSACGSEPDEEKAAEAPKGNFTISSPVEFSEDPAVKQEQQEGLVKSMLEDPGIPLEVIEGEAARRGVTLTDEQRAAKRAQKPPQEQQTPGSPPEGQPAD